MIRKGIECAVCILVHIMYSVCLTAKTSDKCKKVKRICISVHAVNLSIEGRSEVN